MTLGRVAERVFKDFLSAICYAAAAAVSIVLGRVFVQSRRLRRCFRAVRRIFRSENTFVLVRRRPTATARLRCRRVFRDC